MAGQQITVGINFNANVSQAKAAIDSLSQSLTKIKETQIVVQNGSIQQAVQSVNQLQIALQKAVNTTTGRLDFSALQASLRMMNTDISTVGQNLILMGPQGQKAFSQLGTAIATAELPARRMNKTLMTFGDTLLRTIRWQVASTMIHGFISTVKSAVGYIEDLDKSLNAIQRVTQKSSAEMAGFVNKASELASALKVVTKEYTDASLIFFQQGLDTQEVVERTNVTVKLAKVTGQSMSEIASRLTSIWNNFNDGSKSLEYYADVITALGAATASSSDEISQGLQKFAAIADTVGLSYEKATAALATVTANTRLSADTIGTSFKTIFARLESISLGETLEDGVGLTKYTEALQKVGVEVLDQNQELKTMDSILNDLGDRWNTLSNTQKNALASTVAGVRQYAQFIALMDNYDEVLKNEDLAKNAEGTIQKQFDVYADSIEALNNEIKKAKQDLYNAIFNGDAVKGFKSALLDVLKIVKDVLDGFGGIKGLILGIGGLLLSSYMPKIEAGIGRIGANLQDTFNITTGKRLLATENLIAQNSSNVNDKVQAGIQGQENGATLEQQQAYYTDLMLKKRLELEQINRGLTDKQRESLSIQMQELEILRQQAIAARERYEETKKNAEQTTDNLRAKEKIVNFYENRELENLRQQQPSINSSIGGLTAARNRAQEEWESARNGLGGATAARRNAEIRLRNTEEGTEEYASAKENLKEKEKALAAAVETEKIAAEKLAAAKEKLAAKIEESRNLQERIDNFGDKERESRVNELARDITGNDAENKQWEQVKGQLSNSEGNITVDLDTLTKAGKIVGELTGKQKIFNGLNTDLEKTLIQQKLIEEQKKGLIEGQTKNTKELEQTEKKVTSALQAQSERIKQMSEEDKDRLKEKIKETNVNGKNGADVLAQAGVTEKGGKLVGDLDLTKLDPQAIQVVIQALRELNAETETTKQNTQVVTEALIDELAPKLGVPAEALRQLVDQYHQVGEAEIDAGNKAITFEQAFAQGLQSASDKMGQFTKGMQNVVGAFSSYAMGTRMLSTGITQLTEAFGENGTALQKLTSFMMIARGTMMVLNSAQQVSNLISQIYTKLKAKETLVEGENTIATITNAVAKVFNAEASKGLAGVIVGAVAAGILLSTFLLVKNTVETNKNTQAKINKSKADAQAAESAKEAAEADKQELEELTKLNDEYERAYALYQKNKDNKEELNELLPDLVDKLEIENGQLLIQQERYEELNEEIERNLKLKGLEAEKTAETSIDTAMLALGSTVEANEKGAEQADVVQNGKVVGKAIRFPIKDKTERNYLTQYLAENPVQGWAVSDNGLIFYNNRKNASTAGAISDIYNGFISWVQDTHESFVVGNSQFVKAYNEAQSSGEIEGFEKIAQEAENFEDINLSNIKNASKISEVADQKEYNERRKEFAESARKSLMAAGKSLEEAEDIISNFLKEDDVLKQYERNYEAINSKIKIDERFDITNGKIQIGNKEQSLEKFLSDNNITEDEFFELYESIKFIPDEESLGEAILRAKEITDNSELLVKIIPESESIKKDLKEDMTIDEKNVFEDKYKDSLFDEKYGLKDSEGNVLTANKFWQMTYLDRAKAVEKWANSLKDVSLITERITELEAEQSKIEAEKESRKTESKSFQYQDELKILENKQQELKNLHRYYQNDHSFDITRSIVDQGNFTLSSAGMGGPGGWASANSGTALDRLAAATYNYNKGGQQEFSKNNILLDEELKHEIDLLLSNDVFGNKFKDENGEVTDEFLSWLGEFFALDQEGRTKKLDNLYDEYETELKQKIEESQKKVDELGEKYNTTGLDNDYEAYQTQIESYQKTLDMLRSEKRDQKIADLGLEDGEFDAYVDALKDVIPYQEKVYENIEDYNDAVIETAIANKRMEKGIKELASDWDDYDEIMSDANASIEDVSTVLPKINKSLQDVLNLDTEEFELLPKDFAKKNWKLITDAVNGVEGAIDELRNKAGEEILLNIGAEADWDEDITNTVMDLHNIINSYDNMNFEIGVALDPTQEADFYSACQGIIDKAGMTAEQASAYFKSLGYDIEFEDATEVKRSSYQVPNVTIDPETKMPKVGTPEVITINTENRVEGTAIKSITPNGSYGGGIGTNTTAPKSAARSPSGGGGKGGGGGDRKSKELKKASDEIERYHKIDKTIDSLSKQYDRLSAAKDKAFGTSRLKLIERENALLQQQTEAEKARLEEVKKYYAEDRSAIEAYGAVIDENGVISNYDQIMQQELDRLNAAYEEYNAGGLSDEIIEAKEKEYEEFKKILEQFEETNGEYLDQLQKVEEAIRAEITAELERIQAKVEVQLELPEHQIKMLDFKLSLLENKHFKSGERIALWSKELENANKEYQVIKGSIEEILALQDENGDWSGLGLTPEQVQRLLAGDKAVLDEIKLTGENASEIMEALLEKENELQEKYKQMADYMKSIEEELTNQLDEYNEAFEKQISKMEKLQSIAQAMKDTINTIGKEVVGVPASVMRSINNNILKSSAARANAYKVEYEAQAKNLKDAQEKLEKASEEYKEYWQDMVDTAEEAMNEAKENMLAQIQDYAEQAATILEESLAESFAEMGKNLYGMTLDDAQAAFDRYTTLSEDFLQDYQKIYELSKMTRSIQASINNTDNIKAKQALRDLQEEINKYQAEGVQMTQYEVDYLNKKYELRLAEIALEEAQNAKDQVRLSRNADGGWGYVYTANQQNIDQAQQNYEDKLKEIQDLNYQILQETQSGILGLQKEFEDAIQEVYKKGLNKEETDRQINDLRNFYIQRAKNLGTRLDTALGNNKDIYDIWGNNKYGYGVSIPDNYMDYYSKTFLGSLNPAFTSGTALTNSFINQMGDINTPGSIIGDSYQSWLDYTNNTIEMLNSIGYAGEDFAETATRWMNETSESIDDTTDSVHKLAQAMSEELPTAMNAVADIQGEWGPALEKAEELITNLGEALEDLINKMNEYNDTDLKALDIPDSSGLSSRYTAAIAAAGGSGDFGNGGIGGFLSSEKDNGLSTMNSPNGSYTTLTKIAFLTPWDGGGSFTYSTYSPTGMKKAVEEYYNTNRTKIGTWFIDQYKKGKMNGAYVNSYGGSNVIYGPSFEQFKKWILLTNAGVSFDTGGYTGKFGPEGKLAMLHEKELVLNKQDTLNMLKMVALARDALGQVSIGSSLIAQTAASGYASGQTGFNSQNVSIEAHFPNVVDHNEIEQAFNNLANYAAQNAYNFDLPQRVNLF